VTRRGTIAALLTCAGTFAAGASETALEPYLAGDFAGLVAQSRDAASHQILRRRAVCARGRGPHAVGRAEAHLKDPAPSPRLTLAKLLAAIEEMRAAAERAPVDPYA
jgi:hypothetical protein